MGNIVRLRFKDLREDNDLTQQALADLLNCKQQTYSRYEKGQAQPSMESFAKLAAFYHTSVDYLLGLTDEKAPYPRAKK